MDNYTIPVSKGMLDKKHALLAGTITGLFLFLIDRTTKEENGEGLVLGGTPLSCDDIAKVLGTCEKSVRNWKVKLEDAKYIRTARTNNHGKLRWWVLQTKKFSSVKVTDQRGFTRQSLPTSTVNLTAHTEKFTVPRETTERQQRESLSVCELPFEKEAGEEAKLAQGSGRQSLPTKLFANPLQPMIDEHGAALVDAVKAHSKTDTFWKSHSDSAVAKTWDTRLEQYKASLTPPKVKPVNLPGRQAGPMEKATEL